VAQTEGDAALLACDAAVDELEARALEDLRFQANPPVEVLHVLSAVSLLLNGVSMNLDKWFSPH